MTLFLQRAPSRVFYLKGLLILIEWKVVWKNGHLSVLMPSLLRRHHILGRPRLYFSNIMGNKSQEESQSGNLAGALVWTPPISILICSIEPALWIVAWNGSICFSTWWSCTGDPASAPQTNKQTAVGCNSSLWSFRISLAMAVGPQDPPNGPASRIMQDHTHITRVVFCVPISHRLHRPWKEGSFHAVFLFRVSALGFVDLPLAFRGFEAQRVLYKMGLWSPLRIIYTSASNSRHGCAVGPRKCNCCFPDSRLLDIREPWATSKTTTGYHPVSPQATND